MRNCKGCQVSTIKFDAGAVVVSFDANAYRWKYCTIKSIEEHAMTSSMSGCAKRIFLFRAKLKHMIRRSKMCRPIAATLIAVGAKVMNLTVIDSYLKIHCRFCGWREDLCEVGHRRDRKL